MDKIEVEQYKEKDNTECCCGPEAPAYIAYREISFEGKVNAAGRQIDRVTSKWPLKDYLGEILVRLNFMRMNYAVKPGIYAIGNPGKDSPVLVSANYKLSFDVLRREIKGLDAWILVLDTKGVNVWCAAGKGTFGTKELSMRIYTEKLSELVSHKNVIVPQLGAPGVCAHMVKMYSDFSVIYGPVRAEDIPEFINNGMKADEEMRRVQFGFGDRLTVAWLELAMAAKIAITATALMIVAAVLFPILGRFAWIMITSLWTAVIAGTLLVPVLLPVLRGRAFSVKGALLGIFLSLIPVIAFNLNLIQSISATLGISAVSAYLAANFTGASTYTSLSGVKKELRYAIPAILITLGISIILGAVSVFAGGTK